MTNPRTTRRSRRLISEPDERLPDGSPLYGELGVLAMDPETGQVQCAACGQWFNTIGGAPHSAARPDRRAVPGELRTRFADSAGIGRPPRPTQRQRRDEAHGWVGDGKVTGSTSSCRCRSWALGRAQGRALTVAMTGPFCVAQHAAQPCISM